MAALTRPTNTNSCLKLHGTTGIKLIIIIIVVVVVVVVVEVEEVQQPQP